MAFESPVDTDTKMDMAALGSALRRRWLRILLVTAVLVGGAYALLLFVPKSYDSTASILVENRDSVYTQPASTGPGTQGPAVSPDSMISSQIELVKSPDTLLPVVRELKLAEVPEFNGQSGSSLGFLTKFLKKPGAAANPEEVAINNLGAHLTVIRQRDSALINVTVRSLDPALAAKLANAIAKADVARRADLSLSDTADASQWLEQQITQLRKRVGDAETKVANFKIANDLYTGTNASSLLDQQMAQVSTQITTAQERRDTAQSRATLIRGLLAAGQPIDGVEDVRNSVTIQQLTQQRAALASQRAQLLATLLYSHPSVAAVTAQLAATDRQIAVEGRRVADALDAEAKIETTILDSLNSNLDALKAKAAAATRQTVALDALDRESKADQALLESYMSRYRDAASRTDVNAALPDVRVVTLASPSATPSSPKTGLILGAIAFVSLAVQVGGILFGELLSGRALIEASGNGALRREADEPVPLRGSLPTGSSMPRDAEEDGLDHRMAEISEAPSELEAASSLAADASATAEPRRTTASLRTWFGKRAHAVGSSLASFEPPSIVPAAGPAVLATPDPVTAASAAEAEGTTSATAEPAPAFNADEFSDEAAAAIAANAQRVANLSADLILGRARVVILAGLDSVADADRLAGKLIGDSLHRGLSVARVDAGSGRPSTEPGITDLAAEAASFGDVVHRTAQEGLAEVPWGHFAALLRQSSKPATLVEALSDLYEVVLVNAGCVDADSSLPAFAGLAVRLILVTPPSADRARVEAAWEQVAALGFDQIEVLAAPVAQAEVA